MYGSSRRDRRPPVKEGGEGESERERRTEREKEKEGTTTGTHRRRGRDTETTGSPHGPKGPRRQVSLVSTLYHDSEKEQGSGRVTGRVETYTCVRVVCTCVTCTRVGVSRVYTGVYTCPRVPEVGYVDV